MHVNTILRKEWRQSQERNQSEVVYLMWTAGSSLLLLLSHCLAENQVRRKDGCMLSPRERVERAAGEKQTS